MSTTSTKLEPRGVNTDATFTFANLSVTSNVTTANLTVVGKSDLGDISNVKITGGASGQVVQTDGSGGLAWVDVSSVVGQAAGPGNAIQFNDGGTINGDAKLKFNKTSGLLSVTGNVEASYFIGDGSLLSTIIGGNVSGFVPNATHANSATSATSATTAGTVTTNAQPNITSIGLLDSLDVFDTVTTATLSATNINGSIKTASQPDITSLGTLTGLAVSGTTTTTTLTATNINGTIKTSSQPDITSLGTLTSLRVSGIGNINTLRTDIIQYGNGATYQFAMTPPGLDTQVTFNDSGAYAGSSNLTFNKTSNTLTVDKIISNGSQLSSVPAGNLTGTIPSTVLGNSTFYIGTTSIKANRASASQSLTGITSIDGSAAKLTTARNINGVSFDGTNDITIPGSSIDAGELTGATLKSTIVNSSLTSLGTLTSLTVSGNVAFSGANISLGSNANVHVTGGSSGAVLSTDGAGNLSWTSVPIIPTQTGQSGNFLTTNGSTLSWIALGSVTLPSTTGQSGKYLTNDGTTSYWATGAVATTTSFTNGTSNITIPTTGGPVRAYVGSTLKLDVNSTNVLINGTQLSINVTTGTAPMIITSTTRVANLNATYAGLSDQITMNDGGAVSSSYYLSIGSVKGGYGDTYTSSALRAVPSTGNVTSTGTITANTLVSTTAIGNAPMTVTSTTRVANLNATYSGYSDQVTMNDGGAVSASYYLSIGSVKGGYGDTYTSSALRAVPSTGSIISAGNVTANVHISTAPIGIAPLTIASTTRVANLNATYAGYADQVTMSDGSAVGSSYYLTIGSARGGYGDTYTSTALRAVPGTGSIISAGNITANVHISTAPIGIAPLTIASTTRVANLNSTYSGYSDQVTMSDGGSVGSSYYLTIGSARGGYGDTYTSTALRAVPSTGSVTSAGTITANTFISTVASGSAPMTVTSTTRVTNLNATYAGYSDQVTMNDGGSVGTSYYITIGSARGGYGDTYTSTALRAVPSTGSVTSAGTITASAFVSTVAIGTAPMSVTSTTRVTNLNATYAGYSDQVTMNDGGSVSSSYYLSIGSARGGYGDTYTSTTLRAVPSTGSIISAGNITANVHISTAPIGVAPLTIASTTRVANLNATYAGYSDQVTMSDGGSVGSSYYLTIGSAKGGYGDTYTSATLRAVPSTGNIISTGALQGNVLVSSVATGTAPLIVTSTTRVNNLNVARANISDYGAVTTQSSGTYYPVFVNGTTTSNYALGSNTAFKFDAATGNLSTTVVYVTANVTSGNANLGNLVNANYVSLTNNITTPNASIGNITGNVSLLGWTTMQQSTEVMVSPSFASTITCDLNTGAIFYISPTSNFTVNITNIASTLNRTVVVTLILSQTTGYYANAVQIGGVGLTIKWSNNIAPIPGANKIEIQTITFIRTSAGSWVVLGDYGTYG